MKKRKSAVEKPASSKRAAAKAPEPKKPAEK